MYYDRLRLRLPKGVLPYIENVGEFLLLTQSLRRKGTKKVIFRKEQQILHQPNNRNQTSGTDSYT